jgi:hypothetical protein
LIVFHVSVLDGWSEFFFPSVYQANTQLLISLLATLHTRLLTNEKWWAKKNI